MRKLPLVCCIASALTGFSGLATAAPTWQTISTEPGKRIELDRTAIKREDASHVLATARIFLDKELPDAKSGLNYKIIEATTRYDCAMRNANTVKRIYRKNESESIREEELKAADMPVRSGTLDDKVLREVCRPGKQEAREAASKVNEAAGKLKEANAAVLKQEAAKSAAHPIKVSAPAAPPADHAPAPAPVKRAAKPAKDAHGALAHAHWSYTGETGPEYWEKLDPNNKVCSNGQRQSPIDIQGGIRVDLEPLRFDYKPGTFRIVDNGHTIQVNQKAGTLTLTGKTYELVQFHFHRPSEEKVDGRQFDMVAHLVHKSADGKLAVVAVLLSQGVEHPLIQTLWNYMPLEQNAEVSPPDIEIDLNTLLPDSRNYYTYMGSLTTPPCTEGVLWVVMRQPAKLSKEQIQTFSRLYPNNARPIQPAAGRLIKENR